MKTFFRDEARLLIALLVLVVLMNVPYGEYALYPFKLFSTWVHEMSHGIAALLLGGEFESLKVYSDGSGLAYTRRPDTRLATSFVASAGYVGTALMGMVLLLARRLPRVGRIGTSVLGVAMILSVGLFVRNLFGVGAICVIGAALLAVGWKAKDEIADLVFAFLAATCSLNAITSIRTLFSTNLVVNGESVGRSDATTVADALLLPSWFWAGAWMLLAVVVTAAGLRFPAGRKTESD